MTEYLLLGVLLGMSAGFAPGPLLTLVIAETLRHNIASGIRVALAPLVTDLPIIMLTWLVLSRLAEFHHIIGVISLVGGAVILFMGVESICIKTPASDFTKTAPKSLTKGVLANALSPHPYLFWFSVGGPVLTRAGATGIVAPLAFVGSFYIMLVGSKVLTAVLVGKSKMFLTGRLYKLMMRLLGLALCGLAFFLFRDGLRLMGVIKG